MKFLGFNISRDKKADVKSTIYAKTDDFTKQFEFSDDRLTIYEDIDRMVQTDEYAAEALDCLVSDIIPIKNWYEDDFLPIESDDTTMKDKVGEIIDRSQIKPQLRNITHYLLRYGNRHGEFVLDKSNRFKKLVEIPQTWSVYRNVDKHGQLKDGDPVERKINHCAYDQRTDYGSFIAGFYPFQIIHWRTTPFDRDGNGTPFLQAARHTWLKLQYEIDALVRARIERAYSKLVHKIPVPLNADDETVQKIITDYVRNITKKQITSLADNILKGRWSPSPMDVETNFYMAISEGMQGDISLLDPSNPNLQNIADILFLLNKYFGRLKVPKARLANEADVRAKATMGEINTAYASTVTGYQVDLIMPIYLMVNQVLFLEGVINDIDERLEYKIILPSPFVKTEREKAEISRIESFAVANYVKAGVLSRDTARQQYLSMDEKESHEEEEKVLGEKEMFPSVPAFGAMQASQAKPDEEILKALYQLRKEAKYNGKSQPTITHRH